MRTHINDTTNTSSTSLNAGPSIPLTSTTFRSENSKSDNDNDGNCSPFTPDMTESCLDAGCG